MRRFHPLATLVAIILVTLAQGHVLAADEQFNHNLNEARKLAQDFGSRLQARLHMGMAEGGPMVAIEACQNQAPGITARLKEQDITVRRASLKPRNPDNAADDWEQRVLDFFESELAAGADVTKLEHSARFDGPERSLFRYARAIPTQPLCLTCHGKQLEPAVAERLQERYPEDKATGYETGQIRGIISIRIIEDK